MGEVSSALSVRGDMVSLRSVPRLRGPLMSAMLSCSFLNCILVSVRCLRYSGEPV